MVLMVVADQVTKAVISANVVGEIPVIKDFFDIVCWHNTGAAWGIFDNATLVLGIFSFVFSALILLVYLQTDAGFLKLSLSLIIAGAVGNGIDRIRLGYVVDFLSFDNLFGYQFPAFNVADICVTGGCIGIIIFLLFMSKKQAFRRDTFCERLLREKTAETGANRKNPKCSENYKNPQCSENYKDSKSSENCGQTEENEKPEENEQSEKNEQSEVKGQSEANEQSEENKQSKNNE